MKISTTEIIMKMCNHPFEKLNKIAFLKQGKTFWIVKNTWNEISAFKRFKK